ncbi:ATP-binding protein [Corallococcus exercitus]|uniref:ATP-binding protein n=1 Tax=Corallococcus exercitus TaxID=2316736 RepID=UPI0011C4969E|nr:ATP-binding protein [Corallococcus exercitus]
MTNLGLCYEGIQRIYRNTIVRHIRSKFTNNFPTNYLEKLRHPFQKEWAGIKAAAEESRITGELNSPLVDEFDLLGVNHFFNIFDSHFELLTPATSTQPADPKAKRAMLQWIKNIKSLRDPLSHPAESDFPFEDAFVLLDCARRVLQQLSFRAEAETITQLTKQLSGRTATSDVETKRPLEDRLPPRETIVVDFVGRAKELDELRKWFDDPLSRRWVLVGDGGKGKSALAYAFAEEIKQEAPEPFQLVIWMSAKLKRFQEGQVQKIDEPDFSNLDSALSRILALYGWSEFATHPLESKRTQCLELLNTFPALIVVDDIDSLEGSGEDAIEFFTLLLPQTKSKALLTSRRAILGTGHTVTTVTGLGKEDAEHFIRSRYQLMGLDSKALTSKTVSDIISATESSPLYMEDLIRLASIMPLPQAIGEWRSRSGDEARKYALGRELDKLSSRAKETLVAACIGRHAVSFLELQNLTGMTNEALGNSIAELQRLFLVPKPTVIDGESRYEVNINTRSLVKASFDQTDMWRRVERASVVLSGQLPQPYGRAEVQDAIRQAVLLVRGNEQEKAETLLRRVLEKHPNEPGLIGFLGWVYKTWDPRRITDARETFLRAYQLKWRNEEMYKHWVLMENSEHEWTKAAEAAEKGLKLLPTSTLLRVLAGQARSRLGKELAGGLHRERATEERIKAKEHLEDALSRLDRLDPNKSVLLADAYRSLALTYEALGTTDKIPGLLSEWRQRFPGDVNLLQDCDRIARKFHLPLQ